MRYRKYFSSKIIILILFISIVCIFFFGCEKTPFIDEEIEEKETEDRIILKGIEAYATEIGKPKQKVTAKRAVFYERKQELELEDVVVEFKPDDMSTGTLKAERGILYLTNNPEKGIEKNDVYLPGDVIYTSLDGIEMKCSNIYWNMKKGLYSSEKFFRKVNMKDMVGYFEGNSFSISSDFKTWTDYGAKVKFKSNKQKKIRR